MEGRFCGQIGCIIYYNFDNSLDTFYGAHAVTHGMIISTDFNLLACVFSCLDNREN